MTGSQHDTELIRLRRELDEAQTRIRQLKNAFAGDFVPPEDWGLCRSEIIIMQALVNRPLVSKAALAELLWDDPARLDHPPAVIECHVSKLRTKTRPFGIEIRMSRGLGYRLVDRARVRELSE